MTTQIGLWLDDYRERLHRIFLLFIYGMGDV